MNTTARPYLVKLDEHNTLRELFVRAKAASLNNYQDPDTGMIYCNLEDARTVCHAACPDWSLEDSQAFSALGAKFMPMLEWPKGTAEWRPNS